MILPSLKDILLVIFGVFVGMVVEFQIKEYQLIMKDLSLQIDFGNLAVGISTSLVATVSLLTLKNFNKSKLATDRIDWGNKIRDELSELFAHIYISENALNDETQKEYENKANLNHAKIKLLLNIRTSKSQGVRTHTLLNRYIEDRMGFIRYNYGEQDVAKKWNNQDKLDAASHVVLDEIWNKAKSLRIELN